MKIKVDKHNINLMHFLEIQEKIFPLVIDELKKGRKRHHWICYIFPHVQGIGKSKFSQKYSIHNLTEAEEYLKDSVLKTRLYECCGILSDLKNSNPNITVEQIFDKDSRKLHASLTLFAIAENRLTNQMLNIFVELLNMYFSGQACQQTVNFLKIKEANNHPIY